MKIFKIIKERRLIARRHLHKDLKIRLSFFVIIFLVMVSLISYNIFENEIGLFLVCVGFILGVGIGLASGRVFSVRWQEEDAKIVYRIDKIGMFFLIPYLLFTLFRGKILEYWFHGVLLTAFTSSLVAGIMLGRIVYLFLRIEKTLKKEGISITE